MGIHFLKDIPLVEAKELTEAPSYFLLEVNSVRKVARCPDCHRFCHLKHSQYIRKLTDLPLLGKPLRIQLHVHKYFCHHNICSRKVFTERFHMSIFPYARRVSRLNTVLGKVAHQLGGRNGERLAELLGMPVSDTTLLRVLSQLPFPTFETPKILGVDDWAIKKGNTYGTILVDLEKHQPIDLLPDRESATLSKWLVDHPGVEIVTRDRNPAYAVAIREGAPKALQVADRWHLMKNLSEALKRMLDSHQADLKAASVEIGKVGQPPGESPAQGSVTDKLDPNFGHATEPGTVSAKKLSNFDEVKKLYKQGYSQRRIAQQLDIQRETVRRYLRLEQYPLQQIRPRTTNILHFEAYLKQRWQEGETRGKYLWQELKEKGFTGSMNTVFRFIAHFPEKVSTLATPVPLILPSRNWSASSVCFLLHKDEDELETEEKTFLKALFAINPLLEKAGILAKAFRKLLEKRKADGLDEWIKAARDSSIASLKQFAKGLLSDHQAVKQACTLEWSNGQTEGQVNRLKNIKRSMYGKAGFDLLRKRVLYQ